MQTPTLPPSVDVRDAHRLLEAAQLHRQRQFQRLVRHFLVQILHGCNNPLCDTPTCLSSARRCQNKPLRPPTALTATALAHHLAAQENPHHALCPHELPVSPDAIQIYGATGAELRPASDNEPRRYSVYPAPWDDHSSPAVVKAVSQRRQPKKDFKSLGQNLYDSATLIYSYSKQIPSPATVLATLRAPDTHPTLPTTSDQPVNPRRPKQSNPEHVHKIPYHPPRVLSFDKAPDTPRLSITKTGRKSFTLGGSVQPRPRITDESESPTIEKETRDTVSEGNGRHVQVASKLSCDLLEDLKYRRQSTDYVSERHFKSAGTFTDRSLYYTLSDPETLLQSFHDSTDAFRDSPLPHLDSCSLSHGFRGWRQRNGSLIFDALWVAVEGLFTPPPVIEMRKSPRLKTALKNPGSNGKRISTPTSPKPTKFQYLSSHEAAHIVVICIHALTSSLPVARPQRWTELRKARSRGDILPSTNESVGPYLAIVDGLEYEPALRLLDRLLRGIGTRNCYEHIQDTMWHESAISFMDIVIQHLEVAEQATINQRPGPTIESPNEDPGWTITATFMEWLRTVVIKRWDNKLEINKWSSVGTALRLLDKFHCRREQLHVQPDMFIIPFLHQRVNIIEDPIKFLDWKPKPNTLHIFQYPHFFRLRYMVQYFRVINISGMMTQYDHTQRVYQMQRTLEPILKENPFMMNVRNRLKVALQDYIVLYVSREDPLTDALDQIWGQEKKMLLKPLKVRMGEREGEVGLDHGGVSSEFFRIVLSQAFKPENGMFTIDAQSRMMWFQPGTLEPLWKFELLGVLFSLAIYNGITLPVTFPLALYRYLLDPADPEDDICLDHIRDGWPSLAKSFDELLIWNDGDVADVIMREYAFSYEFLGARIDYDMSSPFPHHTPSTDLPLVSNANRDHFVKDYIRTLLHTSIAPQLAAFQTGFMTCLHPASLRLFTPTTFRSLVEGTQHISISALRAVARYEDYTPTSIGILAFWEIVSQYSQDDRRALLEFVTASDRVPITGYESITFQIVRMGSETENLPTASTCFGKLYLPDYDGDVRKMAEKLGLAIRNAEGFGVI